MNHRMRMGCIAVAALLVAAPIAAGPAAAKKKKKKPTAVVTRSATASVSGMGAIATATPLCPKKTRALSGGFLLSPPTAGFGNFGLVYESQKAGQNGWRVSAQNADPGPPQTLTLTAFAYCRKGAPSNKTVTVTAPKPANLQVGPAVAPTCAGKPGAMSGGFLTGPPLVGTAATSIVIDSARTTAKTWQSNIISGAAAADTIAGYAYCAEGKLPAALTTTSEPNTVASSITTVTATCVGKRKVVGGGFGQPAANITTNGYFFLLGSQLTSAKDWQVTGFKIGSLPATLSATAYCAK